MSKKSEGGSTKEGLVREKMGSADHSPLTTGL